MYTPIAAAMIAGGMHSETSNRGSIATPALPIMAHNRMKATIPTTAKITPAVMMRGMLFPFSGVLLMAVPKFESVENSRRSFSAKI